MHLDIVTLKAFLAVVDAGSLSAASGVLGLSQQAISARIRRLEVDTGMTLLTRSPTGSVLTANGTLVAEWAGTLVESADRFVGLLDSLRADPQHPIRVAASLTVAEHLAPSWLVRLREERNALEKATPISFEAANSQGVIRSVRDGSVAMGVIETPRIPDDLASRTVATDELVLVVGPRHPWSTRRGGVSASELARTPLVTRESGSGTRSMLEHALASQDEPLALVAPAAELPTNSAIRSTVVAGNDPAVLSILAVADDLKLGRLRQVRIERMRIIRPLTAVWRRDAPLPPVVSELLGIAVRLG